MPRKRKRENIDDVLNDNIDQFEAGIDREEDEDLDDLIWNLGGFEDDAPLDERSEFEKGKPPAEEDLIEEIDEEGEKVEPVATDQFDQELSLLRIEISGEQMEVVCGPILNALKKRLERECETEGTDLADIWYDEDKMRKIALGNWSGWYNVDEFYHEFGLVGKTPDYFSINILVDGETVEDFDTDSVKMQQSDFDTKFRKKKNYSLVVAGTISEGRFIYEQDIRGEFDQSKLEFVFTKLDKLGIENYLLDEVLYDGKPLDFEHEATHIKDMLDVVYL